MALLQNSIGKVEYVDGSGSLFTVASENWVLNTLRRISPCLVATTNNLTVTYDNETSGVGATLTNSGIQEALVIDGVTLVVGNRVLVKDQTDSIQNGIYTVTNVGSITANWVLTRASDYDVVEQTVRGDIVSIISGTTSGASLWMLTSTITIIGIDSFTFAKTDENSFNSILGTSEEIVVTVANGVVKVSLADNPVLPGTGSVIIPTGTVAERPIVPIVGMLRFNTEL